MLNALQQLAENYNNGKSLGITSLCSAHPIVIRAALRHAKETGNAVLIEATCNQVNHQGGYTGMLPTDFADLVFNIAIEEQCPQEQIILGGDHLGPNPWRNLPAEEAMQEAEKMIAAYIDAGFRKIHLDTSMGCMGEAVALEDDVTASRAARLAAISEDRANKSEEALPLYIIGTEVPPPGGADHEITELAVTSPDSAAHTIDVHKKAFSKADLNDAFSRAIGIVVQPGVEFGNHNVIVYEHDKATELTALLKQQPQFVFEAHSTDYQGTEALRELVEDGYAILKVGPELTFVFREALYALDLIASDLLASYGDRPLYNTLERIMLEHPENWDSHYHGDESTQRMLRHYSFSDRIRYYWAQPEAQQAVDDLINALEGQIVPLPLLRQYLPDFLHLEGQALNVENILVEAVIKTIKEYQQACGV
ncbi:UNVERIFIED_CONTAM: hypothetical protein GTU68_022348 [Idotea baltica]|nr:hypothetical protein [Idotea baltica]